MSSILRAMKKAEQTAAAGRFSGAQTDREPPPGAEAPRRRRLLPRRTAAAAAFLAVAAALWGGIYFSRPAQTPLAPLGLDAPRQAARQPVAGGQRPGPLRAAPSPPASPVEGARPAPSPKSAAASAVRAAGVPQKPVSVIENQAAPPAATDAAADPPAVPAKRPALSLEGIVWSDDPKGRMAVINGKMVREGDLILGVRIQTIGENDVAVAADGDRWTVRF